MANNPYASRNNQRNTVNACAKSTKRCCCAPLVAIMLAGALGFGALTYNIGLSHNNEPTKPGTSQSGNVQPTTPAPTDPKPTEPGGNNVTIKPQEPPKTDIDVQEPSEPEFTEPTAPETAPPVVETPPTTPPEETTPTQPEDPFAGIGIENQGVDVGKKPENSTEPSYSFDLEK